MEQDNMKVLTKTFDILDVFLHDQEELSVTEIAKMLNLNKATVGRIMMKLEKRGYLKQIERRGKYSLGTIFLEFSGIIKGRIKIRDVAVSFLHELSRQTRETAILAVWDRGYTYITESFHDIASQKYALKVIPDEGTFMPLYCTCLGKIILANMDEANIIKFLKSTKLERRTPNTIVGFEELKKELQKVRDQGVAYDNEEYSLGVRGVGVGVYNNEGKLAGSIGVLAPSARMSLDELHRIESVIKGCAVEISSNLGYRGK